MELVLAGGSFACEIRDHALWETPSDTDISAIRTAYRDHGVIVFRRQALSEDDLLTFGKLMGEPSLYAETHWLSTVPEVIILSNMRDQEGEMLGGLGNKPLTWHTDQSYYAEPVTGCFLYGVELPSEGGATRWASLYDAYETLPMNLKNIVDVGIATFSYRARSAQARKADDNHDWEKRLRATPDVKHPLVNVSPATGRCALFIDPGTVIGIDGMPKDESDDVLAALMDHVTQPSNIYEHEWAPGDLVMWDNAVVLHSRDGFSNEQHRLVKRMIIELDPAQHIIPPSVC
jgi:alpha-ketoglutarate-dependent taurine dioxygenase